MDSFEEILNLVNLPLIDNGWDLLMDFDPLQELLPAPVQVARAENGSTPALETPTHLQLDEHLNKTVPQPKGQEPVAEQQPLVIDKMVEYQMRVVSRKPERRSTRSALARATERITETKKQRRSNSKAIPHPPGLKRQCRHCGNQKTSQWRSGPEEWGAEAKNALCNRCGMYLYFTQAHKAEFVPVRNYPVFGKEGSDQEEKKD